MFTLFIVLHVIFCIFLILVILLQTGKGAGIGAAFGGGSQTVFGPRGAGSFIGKITGAVAGAFMLTSIVLAFLSTSRSDNVSKAVDALKTERAKTVENVSLAEPKDKKAPASPSTPLKPAKDTDADGTDVKEKAASGNDISTDDAKVPGIAEAPAAAVPVGLEKSAESAAAPAGAKSVKPVKQTKQKKSAKSAQKAGAAPAAEPTAPSSAAAPDAPKPEPAPAAAEP